MMLSSSNPQESPSARLAPEEMVRLFRTMVVCRALDDEEIRLRKRNKVFFQISSAGHEVIGTAAASALRPSYDWFFPYYRDRALALELGVTPYELLLASVAAEADPASGGRQMPAHYGHRQKHIVSQSSPTGTQFNQAVGCAEAGRYIRQHGLSGPAAEDEIVYVSSGEGTTSQGEFWEALNVATNRSLPILFLVEDNEYAISVPVEITTAGGDIARCFSSMPNLRILRCDGSDLLESYDTCHEAARHLRAGKGPVLLHAKVTRPYSHSLSDDQIYYRTREEIEREHERDGLQRTARLLLDRGILTESALEDLRAECHHEVREISARALGAKQPPRHTAGTHLYSDRDPMLPPAACDGSPVHGENPIAMATAINQTIRQEMSADERILLFGEDVADATREAALAECKGKGGVFKVTYGLQREFGSDRVFNTPLAEASIIGRAIGMALRGLRPVPEIQFLDFIWPAFNQIRSELASMRYRSAGEWTAPVVIRVATGGYLRGGALYHSQSAESLFAACHGIRIVYPSTAADAAGLLRMALRQDDPVLFLEHKHLYLQTYARSNDPGPDHMIPFGKAAVRRPGTDATILCWGALVQKALDAAEVLRRRNDRDLEVIDLRTLSPLDYDTIERSVRKTGRVLIAHEEATFAGFGGEIAAHIADRCFEFLDAPIKRVGALQTWVPYAPNLEEVVLPSTDALRKALDELLAY